MFRQILFTQWRWGAMLVTMLAAVGVALPVAATWGLPESPGALIHQMQTWGRVFPIFAALTGLLLGMSAWAADHRTGHVYALTLPVARWRYSLMRYGAGILLVLAAAAGVWLGALIATSGLVPPPGFRTYAGIVTLRFLLASLLAYSLVFAVAAGTNRTAGWVLAGIGGLVLAQVVASSISPDAEVLSTVWGLMVRTGGPFDLFTGAWLLVGI